MLISLGDFPAFKQEMLMHKGGGAAGGSMGDLGAMFVVHNVA